MIDLPAIILTSILQGIGTAVGIWIGTKYAVHRLEEQDKKFTDIIREQADRYRRYKIEEGRK